MKVEPYNWQNNPQLIAKFKRWQEGRPEDKQRFKLVLELGILNGQRAHMVAHPEFYGLSRSERYRRLFDIDQKIAETELSLSGLGFFRWPKR